MTDRPPDPSPWPGQAAAVLRDLRGALRLGLDVAQQGLDRVEAGHLRLAQVQPGVRSAQRARPGTRWGTVVYRTLRGTASVGAGALDLVLASLQASMADPRLDREPAVPNPARDATLAALNALVGDHLHRTDNPLALPLQLRAARPDGAEPPATLLVLLPDFGRTAQDWRAAGPDSADGLAAALKASAVTVQSNSGRHVADVGRELAVALQHHLTGWRVAPASIVFIGHGSGGLLARAALQQARALQLAWRALPVKLVTLGTPHRGAPAVADATRLLPPLQAGRGAALLAAARLGGHRSEGLDDFLDGHVLAKDRRTGRVPTGNAEAGIDGVTVFAIAGAVGDAKSDGLVTVDSALARDADGTSLIPAGHAWVAPGVAHAALPRSAAVWAQISRWLSA